MQYGKFPGAVALDDINEHVRDNDTRYHAINAAEIVLGAKVAPHPVVGAKEQEAPEAADRCRQKNDEKVRSADAVGKKRQGIIHNQAGNHDDKGIGNGKDSLAQPKVIQDFLYLSHTGRPFSLQKVTYKIENTFSKKSVTT
jgi:hypothetical protein